MDHLYLYVALVGVAIVLFALTRNGNSARGQQKSAEGHTHVQGGQAEIERELRATLNEFMDEFERENARAFQAFTGWQQESRHQLQEQQEIIRSLEQRVADLELKAEEQAALFMEATAELAQLRSAAPENTPEPVTVAAVESPKPTFAFNDKYARVVELSRQGLNAEQIARETDIGLGEIHFVLGLARREEG